ncbi:hypothetical protein OD350_09600 [Clostridium beijerinckii]|uniref:hypothetical protein n=1 Tax=Clostridium beijerinckii TaxID=1520 RepID=UPI0015703C12|nr:hypothetical protein [Clostridium beijerinckii]NRT35265.1 hypothetical protein [Clostridium beijerinckii]NRT45306.1 hypothetical protein [Clostridium beijerinckii]NRZ20697.1 hypothetical protein [Clostridium beijerinckii]UYZ37900.1 hypothetical protein OD350_09600 [Clostridium beijerinckii]
MSTDNKAEKLIEFIKDNYDDEDLSIFLTGITMLQEHTKLKDVGEDYLKELINMLLVIEDAGSKAMLIETIVEIKCFDFNKNSNLLDEYIDLIIEREMTNDEAAKCLSKFIFLGADREKIFNRLAKELNKENAFDILINIDLELNYWESEVQKASEFFRELEIAKRIRCRSGIFASILLVVHPLFSEYSNISPFFNEYSQKRISLSLDWNELESLNKIIDQSVKRKIISLKEANIIRRLSESLNNQGKLDLIETKKFYNEFFGNKNPFDVMFKLPTKKILI